MIYSKLTIVAAFIIVITLACNDNQERVFSINEAKDEALSAPGFLNPSVLYKTWVDKVGLRADLDHVSTGHKIKASGGTTGFELGSYNPSVMDLRWESILGKIIAIRTYWACYLAMCQTNSDKLINT